MSSIPGLKAGWVKAGNPVFPAAGILLLAFGSSALHTPGTHWALVGLAAAMAVGVVGLALLLPRLPLSSWALLVLPLSCDAVLAMLRQAQGGSTSGYAPLAALPVIWVGLTLGRRAVGVIAAATAVLFGLPILVVGPPLYPDSGWRGVSLWTAVALIIGLVVTRVVGEQSRQAALALAHSRDLEATQKALDSVAAVAREVSTATPEHARQMICDVALQTDGAVLATIVEPDGEGGFSITGSAGIPIPKNELRESVRPQASLRAFYARQRVLVSDVSTNPSVSPVIAAATGLKSILYEPILRGQKPVGILSVGWTEERLAVSERASAVYRSLAAEAGAAIERADLIFRLNELARTDELTGLPNRRAWQDALTHASTKHNRPFCVALLDHGHGEGDTLLRKAAVAWKTKLRVGDLLARYGGEEFALLLPDCETHHAEVIVDRLRRATPGVTCSAGIAQSDGDEPQQLMRRADEALYKAKDAGRNRVIAA